MKYREETKSKIICFVRQQGKNLKFIKKKINKIWKYKTQYVSKEYLRSKLKRDTENIENVTTNKLVNESQLEIQEDLFEGKVAVYTCVFGNYDKMRNPLVKSKYCDYYIVTDQDIPTNSGWKKIMPHTIPEGFDNWHPAVKNRYYKMHPQDIFREHQYSLYIDGNIQPMADLYPFFRTMKKKNAIIGMFNHPIFNCLYDAAEHLKSIDLVDASAMDSQVARYREEGFPDGYGFFECNLIMREHNDSLCQKIMNTWWNEYSNGVKRDQQSFTYALWKHGMGVESVCTFGRNIRENVRVKLTNHRKKHEKIVI